MEWFAIGSDDWKLHATPAIFADALVVEMHERGFKGEIDKRPLVRYSLDQGGMCYVDRPWEQFQFAGLSFSVPSEHVQHFYRVLGGLPPRKFGARIYYKLHCYWNCLVLTSVLRRQLLRSLYRRIGRAEARATVFYKAKRPLNEVLVEANEKATGQKLPIELAGPDRHARFRKNVKA